MQGEQTRRGKRQFQLLQAPPELCSEHTQAHPSLVSLPANKGHQALGVLSGLEEEDLA